VEVKANGEVIALVNIKATNTPVTFSLVVPAK